MKRVAAELLLQQLPRVKKKGLLQARKKSTKINFLGSGDRWGSSTRRGGGRKVRALPRKFVFLVFRREESGTSREFCQDVPDFWGVFRKLVQKEFVCIFRSLTIAFYASWRISQDPRASPDNDCRKGDRCD